MNIHTEKLRDRCWSFIDPRVIRGWLDLAHLRIARLFALDDDSLFRIF